MECKASSGLRELKCHVTAYMNSIELPSPGTFQTPGVMLRLRQLLPPAPHAHARRPRVHQQQRQAAGARRAGAHGQREVVGPGEAKRRETGPARFAVVYGRAARTEGVKCETERFQQGVSGVFLGFWSFRTQFLGACFLEQAVLFVGCFTHGSLRHQADFGRKLQTMAWEQQSGQSSNGKKCQVPSKMLSSSLQILHPNSCKLQVATHPTQGGACVHQ